MDTKELLTERELAAALKCSEAACRAWRPQGMPYLKVGRLIRYDLTRVLRWFEERQTREAVAKTVRPTRREVA